MAGETRVIAFGSTEGTAPESGSLGESDRANEEVTELLSEWEIRDESVDAAEYGRFGWLPPALAGGLSALWSGFYLYANWNVISSVPGLETISSMLSQWALPVLLVGMAYLLFMRSSRREAMRFGDVARLLSEESTRLEARLTTVNQELSLAREFIASQSRDLEALGRMAGDRLSEHAERLQGLVHENGNRVETLGKVSEAALENMEKLRSQLPVIVSSAKDVTNNIGNAGRAAHAQLEDMIDGFKRLNEFGQACDSQINALRAVVDESLANFDVHCDAMSNAVAERYDLLEERNETMRAQVEAQEAEGLKSIRARAAALAGELEHARKQLDEDEAACISSLRSRLTSIRDEGGTIARSLRDGEEKALDGWRSALAQLGESRDHVIETIGETAGEAISATERRFEALRQQLSAFEAEIAARDGKLAEEISARRSLAEKSEKVALERIGELSAKLDAEMAERALIFANGIEERCKAAESSQQDTLARMSKLFSSLDEEIAQRTQAQKHQSATAATAADNIASKLEDVQSRMDMISNSAAETEAEMRVNLESVVSILGDTQATLSATSKDVVGLTDGSVRLLELLQASAEQTRSSLPAALKGTEDKLTEIESRIAAMGDTLGEAGSQTAGLVRKVETTVVGLKAALAEIDRMQFVIRDHGSAHERTLAALRESLDGVEIHVNKLAKKAQTELSEAIDNLNSTALDAVASIGATGAESISEIAENLERQSAEAIERALRSRAEDAAGVLEKAAASAANVSHEAMVQLRNQLAKVNELIKNLEMRVSHARDRAEENVDNDFARRAALITESLNSNAIDIAKAISADVTDTAWASYLKGDRGIFTRRAVSLLDASDSKTIQQVFERDPDFREHVSRYIHDFESILRQVLSTRDGNALGVTLLSSDMGKLYVALAQAIERLRN